MWNECKDIVLTKTRKNVITIITQDFLLVLTLKWSTKGISPTFLSIKTILRSFFWFKTLHDFVLFGKSLKLDSDINPSRKTRIITFNLHSLYNLIFLLTWYSIKNGQLNGVKISLINKFLRTTSTLGQYFNYFVL